MSFVWATIIYTDIAAVVSDLARRFPGVPLFLIGTSRGTISAGRWAHDFGQRVAGVVLTATMFRQARRKSKEPGQG